MCEVVRKITPEQAEAVYTILVKHVGARDTADARTSFVWAVIDRKHPCREYRFQGSLGFGGKFRNNGSHDDTPYVDCYPEHKTPARDAVILATNAFLADLFGRP